MDVIPGPRQVRDAAVNVVRLARGGVADLRPMPRTLVDEGPLRRVHHYVPGPPTPGRPGDAVLLVPPLAAPASAFDLRRGCSLVEHLVGTGRPTYLVEYGEVRFANRELGAASWVEEVLPDAVDAVARHAGGRPVHVVGWSLGGVLALLTGAARPDLPIVSLSCLGAAVDTSAVPLVAPFKPFLGISDERAGLVTHASRLLRRVPLPLVGRVGQLPAVNRLVTRPVAVAAKLEDADFLAQVEAVSRFSAAMSAYPGRTYGQLFHRLLGGRVTAGTVRVGDAVVDLAALRVPLLVVAGAGDAIAPVEAVRPLLDLVPGVADLRFEVVPGGHLGLLTGRAARRTTWPVVDSWLAAHDSPGPGRTRRRRGAVVVS
jgi:polyhydroxyalkanoate synthase subunit PhaC